MRITLGHDYYIVSSGAMHSYAANTQNYMHSRQYAICKYKGSATHSLSGEIACGTPQSMEGPGLSMQCLRDYWHWLKIRGLKQTGFLIKDRIHRNVILGCVKIYVGIVSVGR
jgi:hypothetical protein